jgi:hypothetical protein
MFRRIGLSFVVIFILAVQGALCLQGSNSDSSLVGGFEREVAILVCYND